MHSIIQFIHLSIYIYEGAADIGIYRLHLTTKLRKIYKTENQQIEQSIYLHGGTWKLQQKNKQTNTAHYTTLSVSQSVANIYILYWIH